MDQRVGQLVIFGLGVAGYGFYLLRDRQKHRRSTSWPMVRVVVEDYSVTQHRRGGLSSRKHYYLLQVHFSYSALGAEHRGVYLERFGAEDEAWHMQNSLEQGPFYVRYDPKSPDDYVVDPYRDVRQEVTPST